MDALSKVPFFVISRIDLWQIFQLPELPEHSSANVAAVMIKTRNVYRETLFVQVCLDTRSI